VNDVKLEDLADSEHSDPWERRLDAISQWQSVLVDRLFNEYELLLARSNSIVSGREVSEEVKK
jgi:hypothetical protein